MWVPETAVEGCREKVYQAKRPVIREDLSPSQMAQEEGPTHQNLSHRSSWGRTLRVLEAPKDFREQGPECLTADS